MTTACSGRPTRRAASRPTRGGAASRRPRRRDAVRTVAELAAELPASAWQALQVREGAAGPLVFEFAAVRVWGDPAPQAGAAVLAADPPVAGGRARAEVLRLQRRRRDAAVDAGPGGLHAVPGGGVLRGLQELPGDGAVRDAVVGRVAPPHDAGGPGAPVRDAGAAAAPKKTPELTLDRTVRLLEAALEEPELRLPRATALVDYHVRRNKVAKVTCQDLAGKTQGRQIPAAVEVGQRPSNPGGWRRDPIAGYRNRAGGEGGHADPASRSARAINVQKKLLF